MIQEKKEASCLSCFRFFVGILQFKDLLRLSLHHITGSVLSVVEVRGAGARERPGYVALLFLSICAALRPAAPGRVTL